MQTTVTNGEITTVFDVAEFNVNVGESARIDVNEAVNYIKTGQAEVQETVDEGIADFNQNAVEKTNTFNSNASSKTTDFNTNASAKTTAFNDNATSKTNDFNTNASNKTTDFNNNYTEKKAVIDSQVELAKDWATKTDGKVDGEDYSAKYYAQSILPIASDITTVAGIASDVTTVSSISSDVTSVAGNATDISTVADNISDVNSVATDILKVTAVADDLTNIDAVNANKTNIDAVAGNNSNITAVANNATNINAVNANKANIDTVAGINTDVTTVAGIASDVTAVKNNATNINTVAGDSSAINTVAGISTEVSTVAGIDTDITTVSSISTDVTSVALNSADISAVASDLTNIYNVASDLTNIDSVAGNIANVNAVASNATNINAVNSNKTNIDAVAGNASNINTVAGISSDVSTVAGISSDVTAVKNNATDISTVATNISDVSSVARDISNVNAVASDLTNIDAVNSNKTNIDAVAGDLTNINAVAGDLTNINNASTYADNANIWAEGSDAQVQALGGVHSSKGWAEQSAQGQIQSNWAETDTTAKSYIQNKPTLGTMAAESASDYTKTSGLATVATSGNYNDLSNKPTIPTVTDTYSATSSDGMSGKAVASAISGKANDSDVVKLTGNQTIGGKKTFTGDSYLKSTTYQANDYSANTSIRQIGFLDKNNTLLFYTKAYADTNGRLFYEIGGNYVTNAWKYALQAGYNSNTDKMFFNIPTPTDDNTSSKQADTVGARNTKLANYQPLLTSGTNIKTINGNSVLGSGDLNIVANTDLSNLTSQGQNIANWSSNVSNCITEIPQDIKLELNNGTLTLKAGSIITKPDGTQYTTTSDFTIDVGTATGQRMILMTRNTTSGVLGDQIGVNGLNIFSGATAPTATTQTAYWYDTTNMVIKRTQDTGSTWSLIAGSDICLPIGLATFSSGSAVSIDQVFNGFGYIGSTVFALPGVKGLIPDGRNEDGSLKNIEYIVNNVLTYSFGAGLWGNDFPINLGQYGLGYLGNYSTFIGGERPLNPSSYTRWYSEEENQWYEYLNEWNKAIFFITGDVDLSNGTVTSLTPKTVFHALDYNDSPTISGWGMPSSRYDDLTLGASGATYTAPANGCVNFVKGANTGEYAVIEILDSSNNVVIKQAGFSQGGNQCVVLSEIKKGSVYKVSYSASGATELFRFIYAEGENV